MQRTRHKYEQVLFDNNRPRDSGASHLVIVLRTKLDTECNQQATVVGRRDDRRAGAKLFLVQRLEKSSKGNYAYVWRYSNFVFDKYSAASGSSVPDQKLRIQ